MCPQIAGFTEHQKTYINKKMQNATGSRLSHDSADNINMQ